MISINDRLILEQYVKEEIKAQVVGGLARMGHKLSLKPLKVLVETKLSNGLVVPVGSTVYVKEETLFLNSAAGRHGDANIQSFTNTDISDKPFIILEASKIEIIEVPSAQELRRLRENS